MLKSEDQIINLMDLLKIPEEKRHFDVLRDKIQNLIEENDILRKAQIQYKNDNIQSIGAKESPLEVILNTPGLVYLAEKIFNNLDHDSVKVCQGINQSSKQILDDPMFWLRKFGNLSKENQNDWIKVFQSKKDAAQEKAIISYLKWTLKKDTMVDLPCYTDLNVQNDFRKKIMESCLCKHCDNCDDCEEIVKILAPLTGNPNAPDGGGHTPIHRAVFNRHTEIVKTLAPLTDNPNAPDIYGRTPIHLAAMFGNIEIVKILAPLTNNPNAPNGVGITPSVCAEYNGFTGIVKFLAPVTKQS